MDTATAQKQDSSPDKRCSSPNGLVTRATDFDLSIPSQNGLQLSDSGETRGPAGDVATAPLLGGPTTVRSSSLVVGGAAARSANGGRRSKSCSVQIVEPPRSEMRDRDSGGGGYTVVKVEEKHGVLQRAIPVMPMPLAIVACLLNILLPGTGTLLSAGSVFCCGTTTRTSRPLYACLLNIVAGLLQLATFLLIVGWIWSIMWGMAFVQLAMSAAEESSVRRTSPVPYYVRRHSSVE